jgi:hypothetical protein
MLLLCLPENTYEGVCRINGRPCDFEVRLVDAATADLAFRPSGSTEAWDVRRILEVTTNPGSGLVNLHCANAQDDGVPYVITTGSLSGEVVTSRHSHPDEAGVSHVAFTIGKPSN